MKSTKKRNRLRRELLQQRDQLSPAVREEKSRAVLSRLITVPAVAEADHIFVYVHFRSEVKTLAFIEYCLGQGQQVSVPVTLVSRPSLKAVWITDPAAQLVPGYCDIPEPSPDWAKVYEVSPATIDVAVIPGSVFDPAGGRLGYGGGYYDRFLSQKAPEAVRIALAYELQMVEKVPLEPHDQLMDMVLTEKKIYRCRRT